MSGSFTIQDQIAPFFAISYLKKISMLETSRRSFETDFYASQRPSKNILLKIEKINAKKSNQTTIGIGKIIHRLLLLCFHWFLPNLHQLTLEGDVETVNIFTSFKLIREDFEFSILRFNSNLILRKFSASVDSRIPRGFKEANSLSTSSMQL